jgi:membrane protein YqaA with SNARE-associated domain
MQWYLTLFLMSFIAASLFPGSPDAVLVFMITAKYNIYLGVLVATVGSYLGACLNYYLGMGVRKLKFLEKFKPSEKEFHTTLLRYQKYGRVSLLFSWFPFIGDPLTFVAGYMKLNFIEFTFWVVAGRLMRFCVVAYMAFSV